MALDRMVRQCFDNVMFEGDVEEELDLLKEFYSGEAVESEQIQADAKLR